MSSTAAAPSRIAEKEAQNRRTLRFSADPDEPVLQEESESAPVQPLDEVARVERLLSQLEARSMALVPYGYGTLRELPVKKANTTLLAGILVAIWLTTVVLAIAYIRYNRPGPLAERAPTGTPLVIPSEADPQEQKVASSVDHLAKALVSSSQRMDELQAAMERNNRDLQRIATKVTDRPKADTPAGKGSETDTTAAAAPGDNAVPKNWHRILEIKPTESAVAHKSDDGTIDYWLVPRGAEQVQTKVLPIGTSAEGVVVHNLEDGKDYTLTPAGEWRNGAIVPLGN
jgi:hypothetical protein